MTYAFTHMGNFLLLLLLLLRTPSPPSLQAHISAWRPISQPRGPNHSLEAQIPLSRPKSQLQGPNSRLFSYAVMEYYKREKSYCRVNFQTSVSVHLSICPTFPFHWPPWLKISSLRSDFAPLSPQISPSKPQIRPSRPQISPSRPRSSP